MKFNHGVAGSFDASDISSGYIIQTQQAHSAETKMIVVK
jgi:hypothetical protein